MTKDKLIEWYKKCSDIAQSDAARQIAVELDFEISQVDYQPEYGPGFVLKNKVDGSWVTFQSIVATMELHAMTLRESMTMYINQSKAIEALFS